MRISDWSSDVCSSDLTGTVQRDELKIVEGIGARVEMFREIFCRFVAGRDAGSEVPIEGNSSQIRRRTCLEYLFELSNILGEGPASGASPFVVEEDAGSAVFVRVSFFAGLLHCHWQFFLRLWLPEMSGVTLFALAIRSEEHTSELQSLMRI